MYGNGKFATCDTIIDRVENMLMGGESYFRSADGLEDVTEYVASLAKVHGLEVITVYPEYNLVRMAMVKPLRREA